MKVQHVDEEGKEGNNHNGNGERKEGAYIAIYTANVGANKTRAAAEKIQYTKDTEIRPFTSLQSPEGDSKYFYFFKQK